MRWHLVGTDKTYLQLKNLRESPTDNRDIGQVIYKHIGTGSWNQCWNQSEFQIHQFLYLKKGHRGNMTVYLDRIHQYLCPVKFL